MCMHWKIRERKIHIRKLLRYQTLPFMCSSIRAAKGIAQ